MHELLDVNAVDPGFSTDWADIREMSRRLLDCARDRDWESAVELQARRDRMIRVFFSSPVTANEAEGVREGILDILQMDKEVMQLTGKERDRMGAKIYKLQSGRKAHKVYADTQDVL